MAANGGVRDAEAGTKRTVYAALVANFLIAIAKFVAAFLSGSAAMLAEAAHSVADKINQVFLLVGLGHLGPNDVLVNAEIHLADGLDTDRSRTCWSA